MSIFDLNAIDRGNPADIEAFAGVQLAISEAVRKPYPLTFIGQFDLAALSKETGFDPSLPDKGRLLLFYDLWILPASFEPRARAGLRLIHDETPAPDLVRTDLPREFGNVAGLRESRLRPAAIAPRSVVTTIPTGDASWKGLEPAEGDDANLYGEWLYTLGWPTAQGGGNHQLGGWPRAIQGGMELQSQLAANGIDAGRAEAFRQRGRQAPPGRCQGLATCAADWPGRGGRPFIARRILRSDARAGPESATLRQRLDRLRTGLALPAPYRRTVAACGRLSWCS